MIRMHKYFITASHFCSTLFLQSITEYWQSNTHAERMTPMALCKADTATVALQECCLSHHISILGVCRQEILMGVMQERNPGTNLPCVAQNSRNSMRKSYDVSELCFNSMAGWAVFQVPISPRARDHFKKILPASLAVKTSNLLDERVASSSFLFPSLPCRGPNGNVLKEIWGSANTLDMFWHMGHSAEDLTCPRSCLQAWK